MNENLKCQAPLEAASSAPTRGPSAALILPLLVACAAGDDAPPVERADSAGIVVVTSTAEDHPLAWTFEPELTLGGDDFYRVSRWNVDTDDRGVIHVLDREGKRVLRYEPDGTPMGALGGPGQGPGEMEWPNVLDVAPDGRVSVSDFGRGRVITWAPDGSLLEEDTGADPGSTFQRLEDGEVRRIDERGREKSVARLVYISSGGDTTELAGVEWTGRPITLESCGMSFSGMAPVFTPSLRWDAAGARIAVVSDAAYDIRISDAAAPALRVRRRLAPPAATRELALAELGEGMRVGTQGGVRVCEPGEVVEQRGMAEFAPLIEQVVVEPVGRLWVQRFVAGDDPGPIDVFAADGAYVGTLPAGTPLPIGFLPDGRVMTGQTDELDVQRLVIGRFVERTDAP